VPTPTPELDFKRRYAREALAAGLSKDQVLRIYALETGGQGTHDMQSGINPVTKQVVPISSALATPSFSTAIRERARQAWHQLPAAIAQNGRRAGFASRPVAALREKAAVLRRMLRAARSVPNEWAAHVRLAYAVTGLAFTPQFGRRCGPLVADLKLMPQGGRRDRGPGPVDAVRKSNS
jgi:hypothetical protein